jgi:hypothetical protein
VGKVGAAWRFERSRPGTFAPSVPLVFLRLARMVATPGLLQLVGAPLFMFSTLFIFSTLLLFFPRRLVTFLVPAAPVRHAPLPPSFIPKMVRASSYAPDNMSCTSANVSCANVSWSSTS